MLTPLVAWVERGVAPTAWSPPRAAPPTPCRMPEVPSDWNAAGHDRTRPLCAYPKIARYTGTGQHQRRLELQLPMTAAQHPEGDAMQTTTTTLSRETVGPGVAMTLGLCFIVALLEGLDLQSIGVAAPRMAREFGLSVGQMGLAFSAGTFGLLPAPCWAAGWPIASAASAC
ncbi:hypothetical protein GCM10023063_49500 [Arthrobacter methylotrophus]